MLAVSLFLFGHAASISLFAGLGASLGHLLATLHRSSPAIPPDNDSGVIETPGSGLSLSSLFAAVRFDWHPLRDTGTQQCLVPLTIPRRPKR